MTETLPKTPKEWISTATGDIPVLRKRAREGAIQRAVHPEVMAVMRKYFRMLVPVEYGGAGLDMLTYGRVLIELGKGDPSVVLWLAMHNFAMGEIARDEVPDEVKRQLFSRGIKSPFCAAISEAQSTSHRPATFTPQQVTAELVGGRWHLKGKKTTVTGYGQSKEMMLFADLKNGDPETGTPVTACFVIPTHLYGMDEGSEWSKAYFKQATNSNSVTLDVVVGPENLVFTTDQFLVGAVVQFGPRTFGYMAADQGCIESAWEYAVDKLRAHIPEGKQQPLALDPVIATAIGQCARWVRGSHLLLEDSLRLYDESDPAAVVAMFQAKAGIGEMVENVSSLLRRQLGLRGLLDEVFMQMIFDGFTAQVMPPQLAVADHYSALLLMGFNPLTDALTTH